MNYMQAEFRKILKDYGHNVALQRSSQDSKGNLVYSNTLETHTTRYSIYSSRGLAQTQTENMEGLVFTSQRVYYFLAEVKPFEGDRIYEYDPRAGQTVWSIDQAVPMRGINGEIIYWSCGVTRQKPN